MSRFVRNHAGAVTLSVLLHVAVVALMTIEFDARAGTITFDLESLSTFIAGLIVAVGTFLWSRIAKRKGGAT